MALDLFKRVETRKGLFAVEKITLIYNLLTSILILFLFQEMDHPVPAGTLQVLCLCAHSHPDVTAFLLVSRHL